MEKRELETPAILVDLDIMENNIKKAQSLCDENGKQLWPMIKTHKSTEITKCSKMGQLVPLRYFDECEGLLKEGIENIMYAPWYAGDVNIKE